MNKLPMIILILAVAAITALAVAALDGSGCGVACAVADVPVVDCVSVLDFESSDFDFDLVLRDEASSLSTFLSSRELVESRAVRSGAVLPSREASSDRRAGAGCVS